MPNQQYQVILYYRFGNTIVKICYTCWNSYCYSYCYGSAARLYQELLFSVWFYLWCIEKNHIRIDCFLIGNKQRLKHYWSVLFINIELHYQHGKLYVNSNQNKFPLLENLNNILAITYIAMFWSAVFACFLSAEQCRYTLNVGQAFISIFIG